MALDVSFPLTKLQLIRMNKSKICYITIDKKIDYYYYVAYIMNVWIPNRFNNFWLKEVHLNRINF